jgi:hypothetical protein
MFLLYENRNKVQSTDNHGFLPCPLVVAAQSRGQPSLPRAHGPMPLESPCLKQNLVRKILHVLRTFTTSKEALVLKRLNK